MSKNNQDLRKEYDDLVPDSKFVTSDGIVDTNKLVKAEQLKVNGAIIKRLERHKVVPIYIDNIPIL